MKILLRLMVCLVSAICLIGCRGVQSPEPVGDVIVPKEKDSIIGWWKILSEDDKYSDTLFYVARGCDEKMFLVHKVEWDKSKQDVTSTKVFDAVFTEPDGLWVNFKVYEDGKEKDGWYFAKVEKTLQDGGAILLFPSATVFESLVKSGKISGIVSKDEIKLTGSTSDLIKLLKSEEGKKSYGMNVEAAPVVILRRLAGGQ